MIPYTINTRLVDKPNSSGLCPVKIIVTIKGKRTVISTGVRVHPDDWNEDKSEVKRSNSNHANMNAVIRNEYAKAEKRVLEAKSLSDTISVDSIRTAQDYSIINYFDKVIKESAGKHAAATIQVYRSERRKIEEFDKKATFNAITAVWLSRYEAELRKKELQGNTIHKSFKVLRKMFNMAIREGLTTNYPFRRYDNPKYRNPDKVYLSEAEISQIIEALNKPISEAMLITGKYFLLGCYSGLRVSDWIRFNKSFIQGDRLILRAKKNGEIVSMPMHKRLKALVKELLELPPPPVEQKMNEYLKGIAKLADINKHISTHTGRHTFATLCAEKGISIETTAEWLGITVKTCNVYYKITSKKTDPEMRKWDKLR